MNNPYAAPNADINEVGQDTYEPKFFSTQGRLGRLRYLAYTMCSVFLLILVMGIVAAIIMPMVMRGNGGAGWAIAAVILWYVTIIAISLIVTKRRLNDLDASGWMGLLMLVPLVNFFFGLYLIFAPGTNGTNRFGLPPIPNRTAIMVLACILPLVVVFVIGILAAVALPAYKSYTDRARAAQVRQVSAPEIPDQPTPDQPTPDQRISEPASSKE